MKRAVALLLAICVCIGCGGCGLGQRAEKLLEDVRATASEFAAYLNGSREYTDPEDALIRETCGALFEALDSGSVDAVLALFSENAKKADREMEAEVQQMLSLWPGKTGLWYYDGISSGAYSTNYGVKTATVTAMIPAFAGGETFWVLLEICYRDDSNKQNEGIVRMLFFTAEDYCRLRENRDYKYPDSDGLHVFAEEAHDPHVVCIDQFPIRMAEAEPLDLYEAADFLKTNRSWSAFTERFGQPQGTNSSGVMNVYYWLEPEEGELRVLDLGVAEFSDEIWGVYVDDALNQTGLWKYLGIDPPAEPTDSPE